MSYEIVPLFRSAAKRFVAQHHRHSLPSLGEIFCLGLARDGELVGVAIVGLPKARKLADGRTLEVTRVCVLDDCRNANSMLYAACARAAKALGWKRLITYTLPTESGASLRAAGWALDGENFGGPPKAWLTRHGTVEIDLFGTQRLPLGLKRRWSRELQQ